MILLPAPITVTRHAHVNMQVIDLRFLFIYFFKGLEYFSDVQEKFEHNNPYCFMTAFGFGKLLSKHFVC